MDLPVTFQVHANVNADHGDAGLRVTITFYDENGHEYHSKTWRRHVRALNMDSSEWQALWACQELAKMMDHHSGRLGLVDELDEPLF